jgi:hypothetical protein
MQKQQRHLPQRNDEGNGGNRASRFPPLFLGGWKVELDEMFEVCETEGMSLLIASDHQVVMAMLMLVHNEEIFSVNASSKKMSEDDFDSVVGERIAVGRALQKLGRKLERSGLGISNHNDWKKQRKAELKESRKNDKKVKNLKDKIETKLINIISSEKVS